MSNPTKAKENEKPYLAYLSYSSEDTDFVKKLTNDLSKNGIKVFVPSEQLAMGEVVVERIEKGLLGSKNLIIILSPDYMKSKWTEFERVAFKSMNLASSYGRIIAVVSRHTDTIPQIGQLNQIDFTNDYSDGFRTLITTLSKDLPKEKVVLEHQVLKIFLCYSSYDRVTVRNAHKRLSSEGFDVWFEENEIMPGHDWDKIIVKAIRASDIVLIFLSNKAINTHGYFQKEVRYVLNEYEERAILEKIFYIPIRLEECEIPKLLSNVQYTDLFDEGDWTRLIYTLRLREAEIQKGIGVSPETLRVLEYKANSEFSNNSIRTEESQRNEAMKNTLSFWDKLIVTFNARKQVSDFSLRVNEILNNLLKPDANDVEKIAATQIQLLTSYYSLVLGQAQRSFTWALIWATIGVLGFIAAGIFLFVNQLRDITVVGTVGSALVEVIAGINFYLYNRASIQLSLFHTRLDSTQKLLLSNAIAEKIEGDLKQTARSYIALKFAGIDIEPEKIEKNLDISPDIRITHIEINPTGNDIKKEYVRIENVGRVVADMTKWSLSDEAGHIYKFPMFFLKPGASVTVWTKGGKNKPTDLYWRRKQAVWNNDKDIAYLRDDLGALVDTFQYSDD
jgi:hypothetical protein